MTIQDQGLKDLRQDLAESRASLLQALSGVSEEQFKRRPATQPEAGPSWSIAEVLAYLMASDRLTNQHIALALKDDEAKIEALEPGAIEAQVRSARIAPVPQLIHGLLAARRELDQLLDEAQRLPRGGERSVTLPEHGTQSVASIVKEEVLAREIERVRQIEALRLAVGATTPPTT